MKRVLVTVLAIFAIMWLADRVGTEERKQK